MNRWQVRPVGPDDLARLAPWLAPGADLTLPRDPAAEPWLLAEDARGPAAALRLLGPVGLCRPRHWFHVGCVVHAVPELGLYSRQSTLQLGNDHTGACELADPAHDPSRDIDEQAGAWRALLQAARAHHRDRQAAGPSGRLIAGLPGLRDGQGGSPFWRGLGGHFLEAEPWDVLRRHGPEGRAHLAALLPRQPLYCSFLSAPAQAAVAQADPQARVWMAVLTDAGLRYSHHIDIVDGGPVLEVHLDPWCR